MTKNTISANGGAMPRVDRKFVMSRACANTVEAVQDGRIHVEKINWPFLKAGGSADEYVAGLQTAIERGWLEIHRSGTYVKFTQAGAELFA
jgi:hypothetical protein